jgi:hypothetical protein
MAYVKITFYLGERKKGRREGGKEGRREGGKAGRGEGRKTGRGEGRKDGKTGRREGGKEKTRTEGKQKHILPMSSNGNCWWTFILLFTNANPKKHDFRASVNSCMCHRKDRRRDEGTGGGTDVREYGDRGTYGATEDGGTNGLGYRGRERQKDRRSEGTRTREREEEREQKYRVILGGPFQELNSAKSNRINLCPPPQATSVYLDSNFARPKHRLRQIWSKDAATEELIPDAKNYKTNPEICQKLLA